MAPSARLARDFDFALPALCSIQQALRFRPSSRQRIAEKSTMTLEQCSVPYTPPGPVPHKCPANHAGNRYSADMGNAPPTVGTVRTSFFFSTNLSILKEFAGSPAPNRCSSNCAGGAERLQLSGVRYAGHLCRRSRFRRHPLNGRRAQAVPIGAEIHVLVAAQPEGSKRRTSRGLALPQQFHWVRPHRRAHREPAAGSCRHRKQHDRCGDRRQLPCSRSADPLL